MIRMQQFTYRYSEMARPALEGINLVIEPGECIGLLGSNGAGKTTLCYAIMGLIPHFFQGDLTGEVRVNNQPVAKMDLAAMSRQVGMVLQNAANQLSGTKMTVEEEIAFGLENFAIAQEEMRERVDWALEILGIAGIRKRNPYQLSGGQLQRVAIASVLVLKPQILLLDEPTSQLDPKGTEEVYQVLRQLRKEGITILLAEHKVEMLAQCCTRLIVLNEGKIMADASPHAVLGHPSLPDWGVEAPVFTQAYQAVVQPHHGEKVPITLRETIERLNQYEQAYRG
ncbi:energy-coupling factor ABC transporter ATP-binding protein [Brevibacillus fulvus]|uniref:Energy-coupling factor transporter ATP-binding protein EcfA2 n=1 Tax=Brevibacillus fulvus TaxID=1125967 RepID=A0A939BRV5_9BACL|nr:ABC transporter ATP-binding protein [Brevibacillus fulvus]MBM7590042.1 energy-coupling factor transporter ATP-binding protein EcfA2 [Brevibacillus fulvus]